MTVALDGTPLAGPGGGIRRYVTELHAALVEEFPDDDFVVLSDQLGSRPKGWSRYWWMYGLNEQLGGADVFHGTDFSVPYVKRRPAVLMIHDLSPWRMADGGNSRVGRRVPWLIRLRRYTLILTPSEAIKREVISRFGVAADEVVAVVGDQFGDEKGREHDAKQGTERPELAGTPREPSRDDIGET